ncbi:hypothetical protein GW17_00059941 [Ensete ventricosum]|nr:hypothetical protein GW17_00059941 [Ensete ventricosum]
MHPLRFSNSGIRAKVFMRKIGFKLCDKIVLRKIVLRIFVAFSQQKQRGGRGGQPWPTPMQGRPPTARPRPRPAHKGRPPAGVAARRGDACKHGGLRPARKGGSRP